MVLVGTIAKGGAVAVNIDAVNGEITLAIAGTVPIDGDGVIVFIVFDADSDNPMDSSELVFLKARLIHINDGEVAAVTRNGDIALPVILSSFVALADVNRVILMWWVESEVNNIGFTIYRSKQKDGPYTKIGWIKSKGSTASLRSYRFIDETAEKGKLYFYLLEQINLTGKSERFSPIQLDWYKSFQLITTWGKIKFSK